MAPIEVKLHMSKGRVSASLVSRSTTLNCLKKNVPTDKKLLLIYCTFVPIIHMNIIFSALCCNSYRKLSEKSDLFCCFLKLTVIFDTEISIRG